MQEKEGRKKLAKKTRIYDLAMQSLNGRDSALPRLGAIAALGLSLDIDLVVRDFGNRESLAGISHHGDGRAGL